MVFCKKIILLGAIFLISNVDAEINGSSQIEDLARIRIDDFAIFLEDIVDKMDKVDVSLCIRTKQGMSNYCYTAIDIK